MQAPLLAGYKIPRCAKESMFAPTATSRVVLSLCAMPSAGQTDSGTAAT